MKVGRIREFRPQAGPGMCLVQPDPLVQAGGLVAQPVGGTVPGILFLLRPHQAPGRQIHLEYPAGCFLVAVEQQVATWRQSSAWHQGPPDSPFAGSIGQKAHGERVACVLVRRR